MKEELCFNTSNDRCRLDHWHPPLHKPTSSTNKLNSCPVNIQVPTDASEQVYTPRDTKQQRIYEFISKAQTRTKVRIFRDCLLLAWRKRRLLAHHSAMSDVSFMHRLLIDEDLQRGYLRMRGCANDRGFSLDRVHRYCRATRSVDEDWPV